MTMLWCIRAEAQMRKAEETAATNTTTTTTSHVEENDANASSKDVDSSATIHNNDDGLTVQLFHRPIQSC